MSTSDRPTASFDGGHRHTASFHGSSAGLPVELALELDGHCDAFEAGWRSGPRPSVEAATAGLVDPLRAAVLRELVALDAFYRRQAGEVPTADEYLARFPDLDPVWLAGVGAGGDPPTQTAGGRVDLPEVPLGTRVGYFGDYELLAEVARGGMGVVYRARQASLDRVVALKMVRAGEFPTPTAARRFRQEVEAVAALDHPNLLPIHEVGEHAGRAYYTMPLMEGGSLAARVPEYAVTPGITRADARTRQAATARLIATVARAVHHAHQRGILHRDLKPSNVLLDAQGEPHVVDFGLARRIGSASSLTATGAVLGTPSYMAPEQARGGTDVTTQADVYGLGAVLYEVLTGRPPFKGVDALDTLAQVRDREVIRPGAVSPLIDRDLETVCLKCLSKEAAKRYGSADALAEDLDRWLRGEPIQARRAGTAERVVKWVRRNPAGAGLVAVTALFVLVAVGGGVALGYSRTLEGKNRDLAAAKDDADEQRSVAESQRAEADRQRERARDEEARARRYLYVSRMTLAQQAERENQPGRVVQLLRSIIPDGPGQEDLRGWEWHHLWRKHHGEESRLRGHTGTVLAVAFSPDETLLATAGADRTIKLWDLMRGQEVLTLRGHTDSVSALAFSPDGKRLVSTSADKTVRLWETNSGKELLTLTGHTLAVNCVAFSQDGRYVVTGSNDKQVRVWDLQVGATVAVFKEHTDIVHTVAYDPKGQFIISGSAKGDVRLWKPMTAEAVADLSYMYASYLALSADGKRLALAYNSEKGAIRILEEVVGWKVVTTIEVPNVSVTQLTFSPDGTRLAASCLDEKVRVWDARTGKELSVLHAENAARAVAYSRDGLRLATGTDNRLAMIWALPGNEVRTLFQGKDRATSVAFSPDGRRLAGMCNGTARIWDVCTGAEIGSLRGRSGNRRLAWSATNDRLAGVSATYLTDVATGDEVTALASATRQRWGQCEHAFSDDGRLFASATGKDDHIAIWDAATGQKLQTLELGQTYASGVAFGPGGRLLAAGTSSAYATPGNRGSLRVWDARTGQVVLPRQDLLLQVWGLAFSPDGKRLAVALGHDYLSPHNLGQVQVWNTETWQVEYDLRGHTGCAWTVCFSPDGKRLASVGGVTADKAPSGELKLWDMATGQEVWTVVSDTATIYGVAFSPDGRRLATAARDGTFKLWDGTPLTETPQHQSLPVER